MHLRLPLHDRRFPGPRVLVTVSESRGIRCSAVRLRRALFLDGRGSTAIPTPAPPTPMQRVADPLAGVLVVAPPDAGRVIIEVAAINACRQSDPAYWEGPRSSPPAPRAIDTLFPGRTSMLVPWIPGHPPERAQLRGRALRGDDAARRHTYTVERDSPNNCTITGLALGERYAVTVQGANKSGAGHVGTAPRPVVLAIGPTPPRAIRVSTTRTTARVSWRPPRSTGGGSILGFRVTAEPGGRSCRTTGLSCLVTGLAQRRAIDSGRRPQRQSSRLPWTIGRGVHRVAATGPDTGEAETHARPTRLLPRRLDPVAASCCGSGRPGRLASSTDVRGILVDVGSSHRGAATVALREDVHPEPLQRHDGSNRRPGCQHRFRRGIASIATVGSCGSDR